MSDVDEAMPSENVHAPSNGKDKARAEIQLENPIVGASGSAAPRADVDIATKAMDLVATLNIVPSESANLPAEPSSSKAAADAGELNQQAPRWKQGPALAVAAADLGVGEEGGAHVDARANVPGDALAVVDARLGVAVQDINRIIHPLVAEPNNRESNLKALVQITADKDAEGVRLAVGRSGVVKDIAAWVKPTTPAPFLADILTVFMHLTRSKENRERLRLVGFLPKLSNLLKMARGLNKTSMVKLKTIQLTINVATGNTLNKGVLQQEGAPAVVATILHELMSDVGNDLYRFTALCLSVVCTATMPEKDKIAVKKAGGVDALLTGLHSARVDVSKTVMAALDTLCINCGEIKTHLLQGQLVPRVISLLANSHKSGGPSLAATCCSLLGKMCAGNVDNCRAVRAQNGVAIFVGILMNTTSAAPRDVRNARMHAITCIMHMTKYDELCRDSIRENKFLKQIVELLRVNDFLILDKVVWTLNNLCAKNPQNQAEVQAVQGIPLLVGILDNEEMALYKHRKVLRGALATIIHLCEFKDNVQHFLRAGALTVVLFHALVLLSESVTSSEADLSILCLRFLASNNKKAQRIIRHVGGAELAISVQEAHIASGSVPQPPSETRHRLELEMGKIKKAEPLANVPRQPEPLLLLPPEDDAEDAEETRPKVNKAIADSQGTLLLMVKGPQRPEVRAPLALPPPQPEVAGKQDSSLAVFQHEQEDYEDESQLEVVPDPSLALVRVDSMDSADSSPMTTPALSEASTPSRSREGDALPAASVRRGARTPPRLLASAGSDGASRSQTLVKAAGAVLALEAAADGETDDLVAPYQDIDFDRKGDVTEVAMHDEESFARHQAAIKSKLARRAVRDYHKLTAVELITFKERVFQKEVEADLERDRRIKSKRQAEEERAREQERRRLAAEAEAEHRGVVTNLGEIVADIVKLAAAEAEAMMAFADTARQLQGMQVSKSKAQEARDQIENVQSVQDMEVIQQTIQQHLEDATSARDTLLQAIDAVHREADLTEQWQLGPMMATSETTRSQARAAKIVQDVQTLVEECEPIIRTKREHVELCTDILLHSITGAVVNSELLSDLVREAVEISEAAKAAREAEVLRQAELERRMEVARLQAVELFCTELVFTASDQGVEGVETRREAVRKAERERVQAEQAAIRQRNEIVAACAERLHMPDATKDELIVAAVLSRETEAVVALTKMKANVQQRTTGGYTLLHEAAEIGSVEMVEALVKGGADLEARTERQSTPILTAALKGYNSVISQLLASGADPRVSNLDHVSPLHAAVRGGFAEATRTLLEGGASIADPDRTGNSALHIAACSTSMGCVKAIMDFSIEIEMSSNAAEAQQTTQRVAGIASKTAPQADGLALMSPVGAGTTPLMDKHGRGAGNWSMTAMRRSQNAPPCSALRLRNEQNITPLHMAAAVGNADALEYMLERGAPLDPQDKRMFTPLHLASYRGHVKCAALLLGAGASTWIRTADGLTARDLALGPLSNPQTRKVLNYATGLPEVLREDWSKTGEFGF